MPVCCGTAWVGRLVEVVSKDLWENKAELAISRHPRLHSQQKVPQTPEFSPLSLQQFSCFPSHPAKGSRSQGVQARTCHPMGRFWAALLGWKLGPWGLESYRALGEAGLNCPRHEARLEEVGASFVPGKKRWVSTPMWPWPLYKGQTHGSTVGDGNQGPACIPQFNCAYC